MKKKDSAGLVERQRRVTPTGPGFIEKWLATMNNPIARFFGQVLKTIRTVENRPSPVALREHPAPGATKPPYRAINFSRFYSSDRAVANHLGKDLKAHGLQEALSAATLAAIRYKQPSLDESTLTKYGQDTMKYTITYQRNETAGRYAPAAIEAVLYKHQPVNNESIKRVSSVDVGSLQKRLDKIDWRHNYFDKGLAVNRDIMRNVNSVYKDMFTLMTCGDPHAREVHDRLTVQYFAGTPTAKMIAGMEHLQQKYQTSVKMKVTGFTPVFTVEQLYNMMDGRSVKDDRGAWAKMDEGTIKPIPGSNNFRLDAALFTAGVWTLADAKGAGHALQTLEKGEKVEATIFNNGSPTKRVIVAAPEQGKILVDVEESIKRGLYVPPSAEERKDITQYYDHQLKLQGHNRVREAFPDEEDKKLNSPHVYVRRPGNH